jgi:hypothetical protein
MSLGWEAVTNDGGAHAHTLPLGDLIAHDEGPDGNCVCGTTTEPVPRDDGSFGWVYTHFALDGRPDS